MAHENLESRYYQFLRERGYIADEFTSDVMDVYLPYFEAGQQVLDIGCGDGAFMQKLQEKGCDVMGVDIDPDMVQQAQARGLNVIETDLQTFLDDTDPATFDVIFSSNVIEHLPAEAVVEMVAGCYRALKNGGRLLLATPNPASLIVHLHEFWRDATHVRPYNLQLLEFLVWDAGFTDIEGGTNQQTAAGEPDLPDTSAFLGAEPIQEKFTVRQGVPDERDTVTAPEVTPFEPSESEAGNQPETPAPHTPDDTPQSAETDTPEQTENADIHTPDTPQSVSDPLQLPSDTSLENLSESTWLQNKLRPLLKHILQRRFRIIDNQIQQLERHFATHQQAIDTRFNGVYQQIEALSTQTNRYIQTLSNDIYHIGEQVDSLQTRLNHNDEHTRAVIADVEQMTAQINQVVDYLNHIIRRLNDIQYSNQSQLDSLKHAQRRLFPPREIYITGVKSE